MRKKMTDDITSYGDVYLEELSKNVQESKDEYSKLLDWTSELSENNFNLIKEIKNLKDDIKYERELRIAGAKYHNG
jgi:gas vesicle protein